MHTRRPLQSRRKFLTSVAAAGVLAAVLAAALAAVLPLRAQTLSSEQVVLEAVATPLYDQLAVLRGIADALP